MLETAPSNGDLRVRTPAKVNLTLRVLGRRPDGFHDLESIVAAVNLFDTLTVHPSDDLALACRGLAVPTGEDNLVMRAARLLAEETHTRAGARMELEKRIPPGRGLGGGSADAAAALVALNDLWKAGLARDDLARIGARIGSDVPFFFGSPVAILRGRGERLEAVPARVPWWLALAWPDFPMPTAEVYAALDRLGPSPDGRPEATAILGALGGPAAEARAFLVNDLEGAARSIRLDKMDVRSDWERAGAVAVGMTGSGSAYFALADTEGQARRYRDAARAAGAEATVVRPLRESGHEETPR
ncbi:MAG: 4-(cytidine 5'-diphospho)-2-C-methyl-D-erythritol kinase [Phycisphaerae bacterium]|nr:4-(cytidine 5'-diphospho)-2-C-methyl-D-erythritol kinase [Phycisphaerae bacterium]